MTPPPAPYEVILPDWFDARAKLETPAKGHLDDVVVRFADGRRYRLTFVDDYNLETGWVEPGQPGVVLLDEVTVEKIEAKIPRLVAEGFFDGLTPEP
jgi:hypothetical protein